MKLPADVEPEHRASSLFTCCISLYIGVRDGWGWGWGCSEGSLSTGSDAFVRCLGTDL